MKRRDFLSGLASAAWVPTLPALAQPRANAANLEVTPGFVFKPPLRCRAGIRPFRTTGYRLKAVRPESRPDKLIVHNYGHGGAGISLSWGAASKVRDIVRAHLATTSDRSVAVLGSGVMGLTAATLLRELGLSVAIYAEKFWRDTTSNVAGGQWAPSVVRYGEGDEQQFKEILETSYRKFEASVGGGWGVSKMPNYTTERHPAFDAVLQLVPGLLPAPEELPALPFQTLARPGFRYHTLLIEPPIFLKRLDRDLRAAKVPFKKQFFSDEAAVVALRENIIVNCTGYGAKKIWGDDKLQAIKGQVALLSPQPDLDYLFGRSGYLVPRADAVIVGGTFELDNETTDVDLNTCQGLVNDLKGVFGVARTARRLDTPIDDPKFLRYLAPEKVAGD
jgi:D-amino-acid oxidase